MNSQQKSLLPWRAKMSLHFTFENYTWIYTSSMGHLSSEKNHMVFGFFRFEDCFYQKLVKEANLQFKFEGSQIGPKYWLPLLLGNVSLPFLVRQLAQHLGCRTTIVPSAKATSKGHVTLVLTILALGKVFVWLLQKMEAFHLKHLKVKEWNKIHQRI